MGFSNKNSGESKDITTETLMDYVPSLHPDIPMLARSEFPLIFSELAKIGADNTASIILIDRKNKQPKFIINDEKFNRKEIHVSTIPITSLLETMPVSVLSFISEDRHCYQIIVAGNKEVICESINNSYTTPQEIPNIPNLLTNELKRFVKEKHQVGMDISMPILVDPFDLNNKIKLMKSNYYDSEPQQELKNIQILSHFSSTNMFLKINPTCTWQDQNGTPVLYCSK